MELASCRNAIEEPVIEEVKAQVKSLSPALQNQVDVRGIVAYSLNRLPTMYATTQRGWSQQRRRAREEFGDQIKGAVRQGMLGIRKDVLRESQPLPEEELETEARSLAKLQKILGKPDLRWRELHEALQDTLINIHDRGALSTGHVSMARKNALTIKSYLKRSKSHDPGWKSRQITVALSEHAIQSSQDEKEFASYMLRAYWNYTNILENLVMAVAELQLKRMEPAAKERITLNEVAAYTLNRLPPMYATSNKGLQQLRIRAKTEMAHQIVALVREAVVRVREYPQRLLPPLTIQKFTKERDLALSELRTCLELPDLTWQNVVEVVQDIITQSEEGDTIWYRKLQRSS
ncbi:Late competence development protein ComFB [Synechococcus sp. PCC 7502]|uniref:late competence development ComFB family protein n=1 Tax=Synechococcus sp. PCC 7502 TaxID=1173263 RepID=UPI00029FAD99|nr:late competence development ComFB family protein [Synechococcus sp. PCC 7502]AFY74429.1 Late competence development protein ComFB [Synechococcus sp. PCC 7502]